ncbi:DUF1080 domain-containing protein [Neolewinella agarilytica]|uniref:3-keto-disaccharide hydrolase n=1 Tax=Neolewinella agarilytica TaxID=478744 RepID=UPI00235366D2|nr:DUF1080 domain-containing protein [Neolewinella agarilytica]
MQQRLLPLLILTLLCTCVRAQITDPKATEFYEPVPPKVQSSPVLLPPPSDAIVLLGKGADAAEWVNAKTGAATDWTKEGDALVVKPGSGAIKTRRTFGDVQLHVEWRSPNEPDKKGQQRGNSGVFFHERYEVQVLESNGSDTYTNGQAASIYKESPPLVNATSVMGDWNSYDIIFSSPVFNADGMVIRPAYVTVFHNGVLVQNHWEIKGTTAYIGLHKYTAHPETGSIMLQDHSNKVAYRNIWVREL